MLKHIVFAGPEDDLSKKFVKKAAKEGAEISVLKKKAAIPPDAAAVVVANDAEDGLKAALALADRHETLLGLLADAVDAREGIAPGGHKRLLALATRFAQALDLSPQEQRTLERGAILHDIGKIRLPNDVLLKKAVLDYDEWQLLRAHTTLGAGLLQELDLATDVCDIVRHHHECWDGTGYPDGLERDQIPRLARIVKIIDVFCAMTSPRHYRSTQTAPDAAFAYFREERGKHYDPELVDAFLSLPPAQD